MEQLIEIDKTSVKFLRGFATDSDWKQWNDLNGPVPGLAFVGRSNVGKSTLINSLFGKGVCRVSNTPGRTREINAFTFNLRGDEEIEGYSFYFFDLPGYGHASVSKVMLKTWNSLMGAFFSTLSQRTTLISLQDARHPAQESDRDFFKFIKSYRSQIFLIFNKMDKLKTQKERAALQKISPDLFNEFKKAKQIFFISAETGQGMEPLKESVLNFLLLQIEREAIKDSSLA